MLPALLRAAEALPRMIVASMSPWVFLGAAVVSEVAATLALRASDGFTRLAPSLGVAAGYAFAFYMLSLALREMELGVAYAVWSGVGTASIFLIGIVALDESSSPLKVVSLALIVLGVLGLNLVDGRSA